MVNSHPPRFSWWHRDEFQVLIVYVAISWFFTRSEILQARLFILCGLILSVPWLLRWLSSWHRSGRGPEVVADWLQAILRHLPPLSWDRSRLYYSFWSAALVVILFVHRLELALTVPEYAAPLDVYWVLVLGWYGLVWSVVTVYLITKWKHNRRPEDHRFWEGLVGSMFFYHGLPPKSRLVTFVAGFILGGLPTVVAVSLDPTDPSAVRTAAYLVIPVAGLILFGAAYASRWVGTTESGEV